MKCPWRKYTYTTKGDSRCESTEEHWRDCYEEECPFYAEDNRRKKSHFCLRPFGGEDT